LSRSGQVFIPKIVIGPATIEDIVERLRVENLVYHTRLARDVIGPVIEAFLRRGRAIVREEIESPGFYWVSGRVVAVNVSVEKPSVEDLRKALELLNELATTWYSHVVERFSRVVKWGVVAPFIYIYKQMGKWVPYLYLYGSSSTGKTTLGKIVLYMWGLDSRYEKSGGHIDTPARIGHVLSQSTFPVLVNEPGGAVTREDVVEILKNAIESTVARGKFSRGTYEEIPALAPIILTSNKTLPRDDALLRRLEVLRFTFGERIPEGKAKEFEEKVKPRLKWLGALGKYIAYTVVSDPSTLDVEWSKLAVKLLENAYREAGLEIPQWIYLEPKVEENIYEDVREAIRSYLVKRINEEYTRFVGRVVVEAGDLPRTEVDFETRVRVVLEKRLLPWAILREDTVLFTTGLVEELRAVVGDIGGLKSIAELLGWEYNPKYTVREGGKPKGVAVAKTTLRNLMEFLSLD